MPRTIRIHPLPQAATARARRCRFRHGHRRDRRAERGPAHRGQVLHRRQKIAEGVPTPKEIAAKKAATETAAKRAAAPGSGEKAVADRKAATEKAVAERKAARRRPPRRSAPKQAANRSTERKAVAAPKQYKNNLDGWIRQSLDIMKKKNIPGSYEGLHRNIMRESSGNPNAVNDWDIDAHNGIPSKGLLQVIQPTFDTYHVKGTPKKLTDPVANITAAANYAADRYGSIDNVDSAY
ncbi:hypothetical protein SMICM17S_11597 [Streptomyces microflavus]